MGETPSRDIRVLLVEDLEADAERALYQLRRAGLRCIARRVETESALTAALGEFAPDVILSDFSLPSFDGMGALQVAHRLAPHVPFLFVSGTIGEEKAIAALRAGAMDYVLKENFARLPSAVERAIAEAAAREERLRQEAQIARLNRVLRMVGGVNGMVLRIHDRAELLRETCRLATSVGGYDGAVAAVRLTGATPMRLVASSGADAVTVDKLRSYVQESASRESSAISQVFSTGQEFVSNNASVDAGATAQFDSLMVQTGMSSAVVLPLKVDGTTIAVLLLTARAVGVVGDEELTMLREIAGNLSFGLQYIQRDNKAKFLSHFDGQTGLAKRPLFCDRVQRFITASQTKGRQLVVVFDLQRLSVINDSFGRRVGDLLLQHVADRLKKTYPETDQVAHFGGGMFALVRPQDSRSDDEIRRVGAQQTDRVFGEPFFIEGRLIPVSIQTGYALFPDDGADALTLVQNAEAALRYARRSGDKYVHYNEAARTQSVGQLALEHRLRFALERQEFELHYQPKVDVVTRRVTGAEALLRWRSPEDGLVAPGMFLPLLEQTGLVLQVGNWVVEQAARDCQAWISAGMPAVRIAVNIAPAQLRHYEFEDHFLQVVRPWSTSRCGLDIEITEGVLQEESQAEQQKLRRLREAGVKIAIDDFGTGYSSLSRLASLPIDMLKIDRSFVMQAVSSPAGASMVKTIVALARTFHMTTVAEGVETQEQLDLLWHMGCDQSQGFLHCPALPADEFATALQHGRGKLMHAAIGEGVDPDTLVSRAPDPGL